MLKEFKKFLFRGNVIDLAVGVVVGAAFTSLVNAIVSDFLTPLLSAVARVPDFSSYVFNIGHTAFPIGHLINSFISFILVAFAVFFFVVRPVNIIMSKTKKEEEVKKYYCNECLNEVNEGARRCHHCTSVINSDIKDNK